MTKRLLFAFGSGVVLLVAFLWSGEHVGFSEMFETGSVGHRILFELRLPRFLLALFIGGTLAVLGGTYQILFHNALAEPYLLGIASAVTLGAAISELVFGFPGMGVTAMGIGFSVAMLVTLFLVLLSFRYVAQESNRLVLFGLAINFVLSSLLFLLVTYFYQGFGMASLRWLFGQLPWISYSELFVLTGIGIPLLLFMWVFARKLDALSLGDEVAVTLGVKARPTRSMFLFLSSALLALTVIGGGAIGFVGLVTPHAVRLVFRPSSTRKLFAYSFVLGAVFLVSADALAKGIAPPMEFPVGVITTLVGGPLFWWLLWRRA